MLRRFANQHLDGRQRRIFGLALLDDCLNRISQQFANDVFEVAEDIREGGLQVAVHFDLWDGYVRTVSAPDQLLRSFSAVLDNFFGVAAKKDFANGFLVVQGLGMGKVPWGVECLGECKMLLCNDPS